MVGWGYVCTSEYIDKYIVKVLLTGLAIKSMNERHQPHRISGSRGDEVLHQKMVPHKHTVVVRRSNRCLVVHHVVL